MDDELLLSFFQRLTDETEPAAPGVSVRAGPGADAQADAELRKLQPGRPRPPHVDRPPAGSQQTHVVVNPKLDEARIEQITRQLSDILQGEL